MIRLLLLFAFLLPLIAGAAIPAWFQSPPNLASEFGQITTENATPTFSLKYSSYSIYPTCAINANSTWTVVDNHTDPTIPRQILGVTQAGEIISGSVSLTFANPKLFFDSQSTLFVVDLGGGYLYKYAPTGLGANYMYLGGSGCSVFGNSQCGSNCGITYDSPHSQFWTFSPGVMNGICACSYLTKSCRQFSNSYLIQTLAYDTGTNSLYGLAPAAGNLLLYKIDEALSWTFVGVIWGYQLVVPYRSIIQTTGYLTTVASDGFQTHLLTIDIATAAVVDSPLLSLPIQTFCFAP